MKRHLALLVQVAGLIATGWMVWIAAVLPKLARQPLARVAGEAFSHALAAGAASVAITLGLYLLVARSSRRDALIAALRVSSTAVWFAPATLLLTSLSPLFFGAALVLIVSATRLLYSEWRAIHVATAPQREISVYERYLFAPPPSPFRLRDLAPPLIASLGIEAGTVAVLMGAPILAAFLFCLAAAMLTLASLAAGAFQPQETRSLPRSAMGLALTVILASGLTIGGMARIRSSSRWPWPTGYRPGPVQSVRALLDHLMNGDDAEKPKGTVTTVFAPPSGNVEINDKSFPGVVLFTEPQPRARLVDPRPGSFRTSLSAARAESSIIPFSGEYWMFRPPSTHPPRTSYTRYGNPATLSFLTTDHAELDMEARQKLAHPIDLTCCAEIQVAITSADKYPGTVDLELILTDDSASQSLGRVAVPARAEALLHFPIPGNSALRRFTGFRIVFHRDRVRVDRSARISIDHFVLAPRM